jgi:hypothetical protein
VAYSITINMSIAGPSGVKIDWVVADIAVPLIKHTVMIFE